MPLMDPYIVITEDDLKKNFKVLVDSNCACPGNRGKPALFESKTGEGEQYVLPQLHIQPLHRQFWLALNPNATGSIVVFNQAVLDLMHAFKQPTTARDGLSQAGRPSEDPSIVQLLSDLNLLDRSDITRYLEWQPSKTLTVWLHVTNECNLQCAYCFVKKTRDSMDLGIGLRAVGAVFQSAQTLEFEHVHLKYAGGEASLKLPLVFALHDHAKRLAEKYNKRLTGTLLSNGVTLTNIAITRLAASGIDVMISLDGVEAFHDIQRPRANGKPSFSHVNHTLNLLAQHELVPSVCITVSKANIHGLPELFEFLLGRDLPFTLNFYRENGIEGQDCGLVAEDHEMIANIKVALEVIESRLPPHSLFRGLLDTVRFDYPHDRACGVGESYVVIDHRGGVHRCHMEMEQLPGTVMEDCLLEMIRVDQAGIQNISVDTRTGCRSCVWRYYCGGGCPAHSPRIGGELGGRTHYCDVYRALLPKIVRLEGLRLMKYGLPTLASQEARPSS